MYVCIYNYISVLPLRDLLININNNNITRDNQKHNYDQRHRTKCLPELPDDTCVWVETPNGQIPGTIISARPEPRSYRINVPTGETRRNRLHLRERTNPTGSDATVSDNNSSRQIQTRTKTGTCIRPPTRYTQ